MKKQTRQFDASGKPEPSLTRAELDAINETLKKKGVKQKADTDLKCLHCGQGPGLRCNTWSGDFTAGRECRRAVCVTCAHIRSGIVYCWKCSERYRD